MTLPVRVAKELDDAIAAANAKCLDIIRLQKRALDLITAKKFSELVAEYKMAHALYTAVSSVKQESHTWISYCGALLQASDKCEEAIREMIVELYYPLIDNGYHSAVYKYNGTQLEEEASQYINNKLLYCGCDFDGTVIKHLGCVAETVAIVVDFDHDAMESWLHVHTRVEDRQMYFVE